MKFKLRKLRKKSITRLLQKKRIVLNKKIKKFRKIFLVKRLWLKFGRYNVKKIREIRRRKYFNFFLLSAIRRLLVVNFFLKKNKRMIKRQMCFRLYSTQSVLKGCVVVLKKSLIFLRRNKLFFKKFYSVCRSIIRRFHKFLLKYRRYSKSFSSLIFRHRSNRKFIKFLDIEPKSLDIYELDYLGLKPREWYLDTQLPSFFEFFIKKQGLIGPKLAMDYKKLVTLKRISYIVEMDETWGEQLISLKSDLNLGKFKIVKGKTFFKFFRRIRLFSRKYFRENFKRKLNWRFEKYKKKQQKQELYKGRTKTAILHFKSYHSNYYMTLTDLSYNVVYTCSAGMFAETNSKKQKISTIVCTPMLLQIWEILKGHKIKALKFELTDRFDKFFYNAFSFFRRRRYFIKTISMVSKSPHNFGQRLNKPRRI